MQIQAKNRSTGHSGISEYGSVGHAEDSALNKLGCALEALDAAGVHYAVLGDVENRLTADGDIDIVVRRSDFETVDETLASLDRDAGLQLVQVIQHESSARFYILAWALADGSPAFLQLDICSDYLRSGRRLLSADYLLDRRTRTTVSGISFFVPASSANLTYYLIKKIRKGTVTERAASSMAATWSSLSPEEKEEVASHFSGRSSEALGSILESGVLADSLADLDTQLVSGRPGGFVLRLRDFSRIVRRIVQPTGLFVVMMGPDGSGKTTINKLLRHKTNTVFWGIKYMHFRPFVGVDDRASDIVVDPHGEPPRAALASVGKMFYYLFDYGAGYLFRIYPQLCRSSLVIFDRYYDDIGIDPRRYRYGGPSFLLKVIGRLVPRPDLYIFLDASAEEIQSRKQEVPYDETHRQVNAYRELASSLDNSILVSSSANPEAVANEASWAVLELMAKRQRKRMGRSR